MDKYVEVEQVLNEVSRFDGYLDTDMLWRLHHAIRSIPAADVQPVVLCRDCKHNKGVRVWRFLDLDEVTAECSAGRGYPPMDWFCADGEKMEERA